MNVIGTGAQKHPKRIELKRKCKQCRGPIVLGIQKGVPLAQYESEVFCSSVCAKEFHGVTHSPPPAPKREPMVKGRRKK